MAAYLLAVRRGPVRDPAAMEEYHRRTREFKSDIKMVPLSIYGTLEALEGTAPDGIVMLEFANMEEAREWYNSPGYQAAVPFRQQGADYDIILLEGLGN